MSVLKIGMQTTPYDEWELEQVFQHLSRLGYDAVEIAAWPWYSPFRPDDIIGGKARDLVACSRNLNLTISALTCHVNHIDADLERRHETNAYFKKVILAAKVLGVPIVTALSGFPVPNKSEDENFDELRDEMGTLVDYAGKEGIRIAIENYGPTLAFNIPRLEKVLKMFPSETVGVNFDPSHCIWQNIDYAAAIRTLGKRIIHTHAKDTEILRGVLSVEGVQGKGWWRFRLPGWGEGDWRKLITAYREIGYDNVLSFEHEDQTFGRDEGASKTLTFLRSLL